MALSPSWSAFRIESEDGNFNRSQSVGHSARNRGFSHAREALAGARAKSAPHYCVMLRWYGCWTMSPSAPVNGSKSRFLTSSLRSSDGRLRLPVLSPINGRHSHYVLGHTPSETYGFLPLVAALQESSLQRGTQGICAYARAIKVLSRTRMNTRGIRKLPIWSRKSMDDCTANVRTTCLHRRIHTNCHSALFSAKSTSSCGNTMELFRKSGIFATCAYAQ